MNTARIITIFALLCCAEVIASGWVWKNAPTDTIRDAYSGFQSFEYGRLRYWVPVFVVCLLVFLTVYLILRKPRAGRSLRNPAVCWAFGAVLAICAEVGASVSYWMSPASRHLRNLYQSAWYWHRVPMASDLGWPSFAIYMWHHLIPWAIVLLLGPISWYLLRRWASPLKPTHREA
jgi:hypothetical protein